MRAIGLIADQRLWPSARSAPSTVGRLAGSPGSLAMRPGHPSLGTLSQTLQRSHARVRPARTPTRMRGCESSRQFSTVHWMTAHRSAASIPVAVLSTSQRRGRGKPSRERSPGPSRSTSSRGPSPRQTMGRRFVPQVEHVFHDKFCGGIIAHHPYAAKAARSQPSTISPSRATRAR
jgi:hypothetical protein